MKELRDYQTEAFETLKTACTTGGERALMVKATGLGKTVTAAHFARWWYDTAKTPILFMVHMVDIVDQAKDKEFAHAFKDTPATFGTFVGARKEKWDECDVLFASFQSLRANLDLFDKEAFGLIIVDEAHHAQASTYSGTIKHFTPAFLLGMTATTKRMDGREIEDIFGAPIFEYSLAKALIENKWLAKVDYRLMSDNIDRAKIRQVLRMVRRGGHDYSRKDLNSMFFLTEQLTEVARVITDTRGAEKKKAMIFCNNIRHIRVLESYLPDGLPYHSGLNDVLLHETLQNFRDGSVRMLLARDKLNEAIDIPDAGLIGFLRNTDSETVFRQQLGRGLRKTADKDEVIVLDFVANCERVITVLDLVREIVGDEGVTALLETGMLVAGGFKVTITHELVEVIKIIQTLDEKGKCYNTYEEASEAAIQLGIRGYEEYRQRYQEDPLLPSAPDVRYPNKWKLMGRWSGFLNTGRKTYAHVKNAYATIQEAATAAQALGIKSRKGYLVRRFEDEKLPGGPRSKYGEEAWKEIGDWGGFLGTGRQVVTNSYLTIEEASKAAQAFGWRTNREYLRKRKAGSRLPRHPEVTYEKDWERIGGWVGFLGKYYSTLQEASVAAQRLGVTGQLEYAKRHSEDQLLPGQPRSYYGTEQWDQQGGWYGFLGKQKREEPYQGVQEASAAAQALGIKSRAQYKGKYLQDPRLPSYPPRYYSSDEWNRVGRWPGFLGKSR